MSIKGLLKDKKSSVASDNKGVASNKKGVASNKKGEKDRDSKTQTHLHSGIYTQASNTEDINYNKHLTSREQKEAKVKASEGGENWKKPPEEWNSGVSFSDLRYTTSATEEDMKAKGLGEKGLGTNAQIMKFGLSNKAEEMIIERGDDGISDISEYMKKKHNLPKGHFAKTTDSETPIYAPSNGAVVYQNYENTIKNLPNMRTDLMRIFLSKLEMDYNPQGIAKDIVENPRYKTMESEELISELNRMIKANLIPNKREYDVLIKLLSVSEEIEREVSNHAKEREERSLKVIDNIKNTYRDKLFGESKDEVLARIPAEDFIKDESSLPKIEAFVKEIFENDFLYKKYTKETAEGNGLSLKRIIQEEFKREERRAKARDEEENYSQALLDINALIENPQFRKLAEKPLVEIKNFSDAHSDISTDFISTNNDSMDFATSAFKEAFRTSATYPNYQLLCFMQDDKRIDKGNFKIAGMKDLSEAEIDKKIQEEISVIEDAMKKGIKQGIIRDEKYNRLSTADVNNLTETLFESFKNKLKENKGSFETTYLPHKDNFDKTRRYEGMGFNADDGLQNDTGLLLRDTLMLAKFEYENEKLFKQVYTKKNQSELLDASTAGNLNKPSIDKVTDFTNAYLMIDKSLTNGISSSEISKVMNSEVFERNSVLSEDNKKGLEEMSKDISNNQYKSKNKDLVGEVKKEDTERSIQEYFYTKYSKEQIKKLNPSLSGFSFQNNDVLKDFSDCMEGAKNPSTSIETKPSLGKSCFEKLKQGLEQTVKDAQSKGQTQGHIGAGMNPFGAFVLLNIVVSQAQADILKRSMKNMSKDISEKTNYILESDSNTQQIARQNLVTLEDFGMNGQIVDTAIADKVIEETETEATVREIANLQDNPKYRGRGLDDVSIPKEIREKLLKAFPTDGVATSKDFENFSQTLKDRDSLTEEMEVENADLILLKKQLSEMTKNKRKETPQEEYNRKEKIKEYATLKEKQETSKKRLKKLDEKISKKLKRDENYNTISKIHKLKSKMIKDISRVGEIKTTLSKLHTDFDELKENDIGNKKVETLKKEMLDLEKEMLEIEVSLAKGEGTLVTLVEKKESREKRKESQKKEDYDALTKIHQIKNEIIQDKGRVSEIHKILEDVSKLDKEEIKKLEEELLTIGFSMSEKDKKISEFLKYEEERKERKHKGDEDENYKMLSYIKSGKLDIKGIGNSDLSNKSYIKLLKVLEESKEDLLETSIATFKDSSILGRQKHTQSKETLENIQKAMTALSTKVISSNETLAMVVSSEMSLTDEEKEIISKEGLNDKIISEITDREKIENGKDIDETHQKLRSLKIEHKLFSSTNNKSNSEMSLMSKFMNKISVASASMPLEDSLSKALASSNRLRATKIELGEGMSKITFANDMDAKGNPIGYTMEKLKEAEVNNNLDNIQKYEKTLHDQGYKINASEDANLASRLGGNKQEINKTMGKNAQREYENSPSL